MRYKHVCPHQDLNVTIHRNVLNNSQKLKTIHMFNKRIYKLGYTQLWSTLSNKKLCTIDTHSNIDQWGYDLERKSRHKRVHNIQLHL